MGAPHKHSSTHRNISAGSTRGSQLATSYMQMGGSPGWPPGQVPYAPNTMSTPFQSSVHYGMHSQQQYGTPPGFQMAQYSMTKQMLLDQCVQMDILQYTG